MPVFAESTRKNRGFTLVELLVVVTIIGILAGLLLPAVQQVREVGRRAACLNNLRQAGIALITYDSSRRFLPPTILENGYSGWFQVTPYLEQEALNKEYDFSVSSFDPGNNEIKAVTPPSFLCPSMVIPGSVLGGSSYAFSTGSEYYGRSENNGAITDYNDFRPWPRVPPFDQPAEKTSLRKISGKDGASNTFLAGELGFNLESVPTIGSVWHQGYPFHSAASTSGVFNAEDAVSLDFRTWETFRGPHPNGVVMLMCDGATRLVSESTDAEVLDQLADREDGLVTAETF